MTIRRGMEVARDSGVLDLVVASDAQTVIYALLYPRQNLSYVGPLFVTFVIWLLTLTKCLLLGLGDSGTLWLIDLLFMLLFMLLLFFLAI